jgi:hypothetical protein
VDIQGDARPHVQKDLRPFPRHTDPFIPLNPALLALPALALQLMIEKWIDETVCGRTYVRDQQGVTPEMERAYATEDQGDQANPAGWTSQQRSEL